MKRPLMAFAALCVAGVLGGELLARTRPLLAACAAALAVAALAGAALWLRRRVPLQLFAALALLFLLSAGLRLRQHHLPPAHLFLLQRSGLAELEGRLVAGPSRRQHQARYELALSRARRQDGWRDCRGKLVLRLYGEGEPLAAGERVKVTGRLRMPERALNPGQFDQRAYLARQGIYLEMSAARLSCLPLEPDLRARAGRSLLGLRLAAERALARGAGGQGARLLRAFLFGEKEQLTAEERDDFNRSGIAHVLAVSGLHVGLVFGFFYFLLRLCSCPLRGALLGALAAAALYTALTGGQLPALRALLMAAVGAASYLLAREPDLFSSVLLVGLAFLLYNPAAIYLAGFQLSFLVTLGIIALAPRLERRLGQLGTRSLRSLAAVAVAAQLAALPLTAYHFNLVAPVGLLFNLLVVPLLSLALALGFLTILLGAAPLLAQVFGASAGLAAELLLACSRLCASLPGGHFHLPAPLALSVLAYYLAFFTMTGHLPGRRAWRLALLGLGLLCLGGEAWQWRARAPRARLEMSFLAVGQGDSCLIRGGDGATLLVDCSTGPPVNGAARAVAPFLWERGLRRLDRVVVSHPDADHAGGLAYLAKNFRPGEVTQAAISGQEFAGPGGSVVRVLHPPPGGWPGGGNDNGIVLLVECAGRRAFFGGDAGQQVEESLLPLPGEGLDVLKVGHHGSAGSSSAAFLAATRPRLAVVSCASRDEQGLPAREALERLAACGARVLRTDEAGMVSVFIHADGRMEVETFLGDKVD